MIKDRRYTGGNNLEDTLLFLLSENLDNIIYQNYDEDRANTIPSVIYEGMDQ